MQHALNIVQIVAFLASFCALASRLFVASRPFWSRLPAFYQAFLPALVPALATLTQGLTGVKSWGDLSVQFMVCAAMLLPGLPSNRSAAPLQAGKEAVREPSAGDQAVAAAVAKKASVPPPSDKTPPWGGPASGIAALLLAVCFAHYVTACALFGAHGSFWPKVEHCAPSPAHLLSQVTDILLAGGDYEKSLEDLALIDSAEAVECAIKAAVDSLASKVGASPEDGSALARGKAFLAEHPVK